MVSVIYTFYNFDMVSCFGLFFFTHVLKDLTVLLTHTLSVKSEVLYPEYEQTQDFSITVLSIKVVNCMCF